MTYNPFSVQFLRSALRHNNLWLSSRRGQNYLTDKNIAEKLISHIPDNSVVLEAGSGLGALTHLMVRQFKTYSIELDGGIYDLLKAYLSNDNLVLINGDFLKYDLGAIKENRLFFVSNTPYSIAGEIVRKFVGSVKFSQGLCMLQDEMVRRMAADVSSASYGPFAILCCLYLDIKKLFTVVRKSFYPEPSVDSIVIRMEKKGFKIPQDDFNKFLRKGFLARRKTLYNNLKLMGFSIAGIEALGLDPSLRPQDIDPPGWVKLYKLYVSFRMKCLSRP